MQKADKLNFRVRAEKTSDESWRHCEVNQQSIRQNRFPDTWTSAKNSNEDSPWQVETGNIPERHARGEKMDCEWGNWVDREGKAHENKKIGLIFFILILYSIDKYPIEVYMNADLYENIITLPDSSSKSPGGYVSSMCFLRLPSSYFPHLTWPPSFLFCWDHSTISSWRNQWLILASSCKAFRFISRREPRVLLKRCFGLNWYIFQRTWNLLQ